MCGRSSLHEEPRDLLESYGLPPRLEGFIPRFNITPSQTQWAILLNGERNLEARGLRWGLIPSWAKDSAMSARMINARAETISEKPSFRDALRARRCLIMTDGYYEWSKTASGKTPFRFQMKGGNPFVFAGLWDRWKSGGDCIDSCTIVTVPAGNVTAQIHDRMPVILDLEASFKWIHSRSVDRDLLSLLRAYPNDDLDVFEVSRAVNNPANDSAECLLPATVQAASRII